MKIVLFALGLSEEPPKSPSWIQLSVCLLWLSNTLLWAWASSRTEWLTGESQGPQCYHTNDFGAESHSGGMWETPRQHQGCCSTPQSTMCHHHVWHWQPWHVLTSVAWGGQESPGFPNTSAPCEKPPQNSSTEWPSLCLALWKVSEAASVFHPAGHVTLPSSWFALSDFSNHDNHFLSYDHS